MAKSKLSQAKHRIGSARITGYSRPIRNLKFRTSKGYSYGLKSKQRADFNRQNTTVDLPKHRLSTAVMGAKHRISGQVGDAIVNYTPDLYDTSQGNKDYATHTSAKLLGNGFMTARTGYRLTKSIKRRNWAKKREKYAQQGDIKKVAKIDRKLKYSTGFDLKSSTKRMMRNQSRKLMNEISSNEDNATATLGKGMKLSINAIKYRKQMVKSIKTVGSFIKSLLTGLITFVTSVPTVIVSILTSVPIMIIMIVVVLVIGLVSTGESTNWRLDALIKYEQQLEAEFGIDIDVVYLSCVEDALGWTRGITYSKCERLVAYYYIDTPYISTYKNKDSKYYCSNPKDAKSTDFETGLKRVFYKQNPAKSLNNNDRWGVREDIDKDSMTYSSLKNVNQPVINFYPEYKELELGNDSNNSNVRAYYGSDKKINELINYAKQRYNANLSFYATYGTTNTLPDGNVLENGTIPQKAVELGKGKLGCRYWWGQAGPTYFDCSGFVSWCYNTAGYNIGHQTTKTLIKMGKEVPKDRTQLQVGDLILSNSSGSGQPSHVTMYIGNGEIIGANGGGSKTKGDNPKACVSIKKMDYYFNHAVGIRRLAE